jgi:hypothetical protein
MAQILTLLLSTWQRQSDLRYQTHREGVYRPFQFQKRSQQFVRADDKTPSVVAVRVNNPDRSLFKIPRLGKSPSFMTTAR